MAQKRWAGLFSVAIDKEGKKDQVVRHRIAINGASSTCFPVLTMCIHPTSGVLLAPSSLGEWLIGTCFA
jgi:hypothetical protein